MRRSRVLSSQAVRVLRALAADPGRRRYGYDLGVEVGLRSGSLYPILARLSDRGLLEAGWESGNTGKPPRHMYRLTTAGQQALASLDTERAATMPARLREA
jgi:PadR family transcriptional regulator, regulatory protein PadR